LLDVGGTMKITTACLSKKVDLRLTPNQYDVCIMYAKNKGYRSVAAFLRAILVGRETLIEEHILETNKLVKQLLET
jgi:hypothetical protein